MKKFQYLTLGALEALAFAIISISNPTNKYSKYEFKGYIGDSFLEFKTERNYFKENINSLMYINDKFGAIYLDNEGDDLIIDEIILCDEKARITNRINKKAIKDNKELELLKTGRDLFKGSLERILRIKEESESIKKEKPKYQLRDNTHS